MTVLNQKNSDEQNDFVLKVESLGKRYASASPERWAVRNVSFLLKSGGTLAVVGSNGGGKSTLLRMLAGVIYPTEGRVTGRGRMVSLHALHLPFSPFLSLRDAMIAQAGFWGVTRSEALAGLDEVLDWCEITLRPDEKLFKLSDGMINRLAFASTLFLKPRLILADGNLGAGDAIFHERCLDRIEAMISEGCALVLATHRQALVERFCENVLVLQDGCVVDKNAWPTAASLGSGNLDELDAFEEDEEDDTSAGQGDSHVRGVISMAAEMAADNGLPACDITTPPTFQFAAEAPPEHVLRFKADFFKGRTHAFRLVSPEFIASQGQMHFKLSLPSLMMMVGDWRCELATVYDDGKQALVKFRMKMSDPASNPTGDWRGRLPGVITPDARWNLERLPDVAPDQIANLTRNMNGAIHAINIESGGMVRTSDALHVALDFSLYVADLKTRCSLDFLYKGERAFRAIMPWPQVLEPGRWRATLSVHPDQLAEGDYSINVVMVFPEPEGPTPLLLYGACSFHADADTGGGTRGGWTGPMPGIVMPKGLWALQDSEA